MNNRWRQREKALKTLPWNRKKMYYLLVSYDAIVKKVAQKINEMEKGIKNAIKHIAKVLERKD